MDLEGESQRVRAHQVRSRTHALTLGRVNFELQFLVASKAKMLCSLAGSYLHSLFLRWVCLDFEIFGCEQRKM